MPAEQFGGKGIDRRADVFAVGVILWQALTGRKLWKDLSDAEIFQNVASGNVPMPSSIKPGIPPELEAICMKALAHQPAGD
jgi:serine/threonine-protein kinase